MNLKDRLSNIKQTNNVTIKEEADFDSCVNVSDIFVDSTSVKKIITSAIEKSNNLIFVSDKSIDKNIVAYYVQSLFENKEIELFNTIEDNIPTCLTKINLIPNPSIKQVVKILEYIIYGYKPFIFGLDMASDDKLIDKLKAIIALNYSNLTEENIDTLIGCSNSYFISVEKNQNGLLFVSKIQKLDYADNNLLLNLVYPLEKKEEIIEINNSIEISEEEKVEDNIVLAIEEEKETDIVIENSEIEISTSEETSNIENENLIENEEINESELKEDSIETEISTEALEEKPLLKINKYKLLRQKLKNKRNDG